MEQSDYLHAFVTFIDQTFADTLCVQALQKANTAVLLDNAQNFEGAMQAYSEACSLLHQVMARSSGDDDRRKLEAIVSGQTRCGSGIDVS